MNVGVSIGQRTVTDTTHVQVATIAKRNAPAPGGKKSVWGMLVTALVDNKTYQLKRGLVDNDIKNNANWEEFTSGGGGSSYTFQNGIQEVTPGAVQLGG